MTRVQRDVTTARFHKRSNVSTCKRARNVPVLSDEDEATIIELVKNHPELYLKENTKFVAGRPCGETTSYL